MGPTSEKRVRKKNEKDQEDTYRKKVLRLKAKGYTNLELSRMLGISESSVRIITKEN